MSIPSFLEVPVAYAAGIVSAPDVPGYDNPSGVMGVIVGQVCNAATWIFMAAIILSIIFTLMAAIGYMRSSGDPGQVKTATNRIVYAAIGVAVALVAFLFPSIIAGLVGAGTLGKAC